MATTLQQPGVSSKAIVKAIIFGPKEERKGITGGDRNEDDEIPHTKELPQDDPFAQLVTDGLAIEAPFEKMALAMLPENSSALGPVIEAMVVNVDGFGQRLDARVNVDDPSCPPGVKSEVAKERAKLLNFLNTCCTDYSFTELRKRTRQDIETTGEAFWEVIRSPVDGRIVQLNHIPSYQMALGIQSKEFYPFTRKVPQMEPDGSVKLVDMTRKKRFRKFVQRRLFGVMRALTVSGAPGVRWFKEYGDPRTMDCTTGKILEAGKESEIPKERYANEVIHWRLYSPRTPYGMPRYIGNLVSIYGDRAADEINYVTLKNNNIPSMIISVSNGSLTEGTITRIQEFVEKQIQGSSNYSRFLLLEADTNTTDAGEEGRGAAKINIQPMTNQQARDQLFSEYGKTNGDRVREVWRMPPILTGRSTDYTRATADASRKLADEQIFRPLRDEFDYFMNHWILPDLGVLYHSFKSNNPPLTDDQDLIQVLATAERTGGMTPRIARMVISDILGIERLPALDKSINPDIPFSLQLAEAVKNTAPIEAQPAVKGILTEGQAVIKSMLLSDLLGARSDLEVELLKAQLSLAKQAS